MMRRLIGLGSMGLPSVLATFEMTVSSAITVLDSHPAHAFEKTCKSA